MTITKRTVLAMVMIVGVSTMAGAGSYAYLTDSDVTDISFQTGSLEVTAEPSTLDFGDVAESSHTGEVSIVNNGSIPARQVHWTNLRLDGPSEATQATEVHSITYRGEDVTDDVLGQVDGSGNGNGIYDLQDLSMYLTDEDIDLESLVGGDGLEPNGNETADMSVTIGVDYSQNVTTNAMGVTAGIEVTGHQQAADPNVTA